MFIRRDKVGPDPHLTWKIRLFGLGAMLALIGMARNNRWFLLGAFIMLCAGILIRFLPEKKEPSED